MLEKIISGGQTGADQGALDAAIEAGLAHGGWIPKGRKTESGPLPAAYQLKEMPTTAYPPRTARNVAEADATVIVSHGPLKGGSLLTQTLARNQAKPVLHLDLSQTAAFAAARQLSDWLRESGIRVLNVAGPRASEDPAIYQKTRDIITTAILLGQVAAAQPTQGRGPADSAPEALPATIEAAIALLIADMSLKDRATVANMSASELDFLRPTMGRHILDRFGLEKANAALLNACRFSAGKTRITPAKAVDVIIAALWDKLRQSHRLRRVK